MTDFGHERAQPFGADAESGAGGRRIARSVGFHSAGSAGGAAAESSAAGHPAAGRFAAERGVAVWSAGAANVPPHSGKFLSLKKILV